MKYLAWLLKAAIFLLVFAFALNNQAPVRLHLLFGGVWDAPLVLILLAVLAVGVFLGIAVMVPIWLRARRQARQATTTAGGSEALPTVSDDHLHGI